MKIGVDLEVTRESGHIADTARYVEALGFDSLFLPEHPAIPVHYQTYYRWGNDGKLPENYTRWVDPYIALTVAATVTTRIQIGTGISLMPEHEPIVTAKMIATLDMYSNGRLTVAFGAGWLREETEALGVDFKTRWMRLRESVEAMKRLWSEDEASYDGQIIKFPPLISMPKPTQKGGPKVLLGVHVPEKAIPRIVRYCDGWFALMPDPVELGRNIAELKRQAEAAGRDPEGFTVIPILVAENDDVSLARLEAYRAVGIEHLVLIADDHGIRNANGQSKQWLDSVAHLVERAHSLD